MEHAPAWLVNSLIYLSAAVIAVPLSKAVGLGSILGYLAAGIVIGPWGFGLVRNVEDILHFAEFGVVLMLFLIGLELEPRRLWSLRRPIFGWGSAQVLGCAALLFAAGVLAGAPWRTSLVAALGLALSSTAIALQVMGERNLMPTSTGQAGFSILLFQDVAAIPILALLPLLGSGGDTQPQDGHSAWEAVRIVLVIGGIILGGRLLLRPLLRLIAKSRTPEIFTAAALLLVVAIAALMQLVGLSMALGAFLAGVLLAQGGEFAFVVFQAAAGARVFSGDTASLLIGAVAVSMLLTPLLLVAVDRFVLPRLDARSRKLDELSEPQDAPVIIAGFGRYGQIIGRLLNAQGIVATVLDHDADMVEAARSFGYKVHYGDATRLDLLRTAGMAAA